MPVYYPDSEEFKKAEKESKNDTYMIVACSDILNLSQSINEYMKKGWKPLGGMTPVGNWDRYFQTMIKEK